MAIHTMYENRDGKKTNRVGRAGKDAETIGDERNRFGAVVCLRCLKASPVGRPQLRGKQLNHSAY